jgi:hypothetical protein
VYQNSKQQHTVRVAHRVEKNGPDPPDQAHALRLAGLALE